MRYNTRSRYVSSANWSFPPGVKWLIVANCAVFLLDFAVSLFSPGLLDRPFALVPIQVAHGAIWQLVTYLFLHSLGFPFFHLIFNMLALWMFGQAVEQTWGTRRFVRYYFVCGIGAGICVVIANLLFGNPRQPTIGASGAIYGVLLAFGMLFPDQTVLMNFLFPIKAKYLVMIYGAIAFFGSFQTQSPVSSLAHTGRDDFRLRVHPDHVRPPHTGIQTRSRPALEGIPVAARQEEISGVHEEAGFGTRPLG